MNDITVKETPKIKKPILVGLINPFVTNNTLVCDLIFENANITVHVVQRNHFFMIL